MSRASLQSLHLRLKKALPTQILHPKCKILPGEQGKILQKNCNVFTQPNFFLCKANTAVVRPQSRLASVRYLDLDLDFSILVLA